MWALEATPTQTEGWADGITAVQSRREIANSYRGMARLDVEVWTVSRA